MGQWDLWGTLLEDSVSLEGTCYLRPRARSRSLQDLGSRSEAIPPTRHHLVNKIILVAVNLGIT